MPPRAVAKSAPAKVDPAAGQERSRIVTRYVASCPFDGCPFNERAARKPQLSKDAAVVETIRHLRESDHIQPEQVSVRRLAVVQRRIVSETIV